MKAFFYFLKCYFYVAKIWYYKVANNNNFNCSEYVEIKANEYLAKNRHVRLLSFNNNQCEQILKSLIARAHKIKPPFFKTAKNSDAGFKDSVIWETLLNYQEIEKFHKVILVTRDEGFKGCETEFTSRWNKHFKIISAPEAVNIELGVDYKNFIEERVIYDFAQTEYFGDYLYDDLKTKSIIVIEGTEYNIENYSIVDICMNVKRMLPNEDEDENILLSSEIKIHFSVKGEKKVQKVEALTTLYDDESKEIISTEYDLELK